MTMPITIKYKPLILGATVNTKVLNVEIEKLIGMLCFANLLVGGSHDIDIAVSGGISIDIRGLMSLPYFKYVYPFKVNICYGTTECATYSFMTKLFIDGISDLCMLLGMDPRSYIRDIIGEDDIKLPISSYINRYIGKINVPNLTDRSDGSAIHISNLRRWININTYDSFYNLMNNCFADTSDIYVIIPSIIYFISEDENYGNLIAALMACPEVPDYLSDYTNAFYISSVCTHSDHRQKGLAKSLMITMLNDLISQGVTEFALEVLPSNTSAYNLYTSLVFVKLDPIYLTELNIVHDLLLLSLV